jgi:phytoene synthase
MKAVVDDPLPPEARLALAWSPPHLRAAFATLLQLDRRLAKIVARTSEPMLGQIRLAWWREALGKPLTARPRGDVVLDALGEHWSGREDLLVAMLDGWECLLAADTLSKDDLVRYAAGRAAPFAGLVATADRALQARITLAASRYALADLAANLSNPAEREAAIALGLKAQPRPTTRMPRALRGLGVLEALALRALARGGRPLMEGRGASLVALKAAVFPK